MNTKRFIQETGLNESGTAKIVDDSELEWVHYSRRNNTLKIRRFSNLNVNEDVYDLGTDDCDADEIPIIEEWLTRSEIKSMPIFNNLSLSVNDLSNWQEVLSKLNSGDVDSTQIEPENTKIVPVINRVTRLRRYYKGMKNLEKALFQPISKFYQSNPNKMESHWNNSHNKFKDYNCQEGWSTEEGRQTIERFTGELNEVSGTNEFTSFIKQYGLGDSGYTYVHREINPSQTQKAVYSKNPKMRNTTGAGGIDLLFSSSEGLPVIGEVKVKEDMNAFFALLQAMTYAVELSTPYQLLRLKTHFAPHFDKLDPTAGSVEIAIILVNHDEKKDPTWNSTLSLISRLNENRRCKNLNAISLFKNHHDGHWLYLDYFLKHKDNI